MNDTNDMQLAEICKLNAETAKLELEIQEIKLRLNNKWWQGTSLLKYIVATVIAIGLILAWVQSFVTPLLNHQKEINNLKTERDKIQNELLTAQKNTLTEKQAKLEIDIKGLTELRKNLESQNKKLQKDKLQLEGNQARLEKDKAALAARQKTLKTAITILKTVINKDGRDYFSILNRDDPINALRDFGWNLPSTDYITWLGYYIYATNQDVWDGKEIYIAREFEVDDLKRDYPNRWNEKLKKVTDYAPLLALDYTYVALQVDKKLAAGGTLYLKDGKIIDFYYPLDQWAEKLNSILTSE